MERIDKTEDALIALKLAQEKEGIENEIVYVLECILKVINGIEPFNETQECDNQDLISRAQLIQKMNYIIHSLRENK